MTRLYSRRIRTVAWLVFAMVTMFVRCAPAKDPQPAMDPAAASALEALRAGKPQDAADQLGARVKDDPSAAPAADAAKRFAERTKTLRAEHQRAYGEALDKAKALLASEPENAADVLALARRAAPDGAAASNDATFADLATHLARRVMSWRRRDAGLKRCICIPRWPSCIPPTRHCATR